MYNRIRTMTVVLLDIPHPLCPLGVLRQRLSAASLRSSSECSAC